MLLRLGLVLTLIVLLLASVRFARYDWTGIPLERLPDQVERVVSDDCTELIGTYETDTGRVLQPVTVDDEQYMSLVAMYRGTPRAELQSECLYSPYVGRIAQPWLASHLPFDEATSLATTNVALMVLALWAMLATLRAQRFSPRAFAVVGTLFAVNWNTLLMSSVIMTDSGVLATVAVGWWLIATRRLWWTIVFVAVALPVRETVLALVPVMMAAAYFDYRSPGSPAHEDRARLARLVGAGALVAAAAYVMWGALSPTADASWGSKPSLSTLAFNIGTPTIITIFIAGVPLYLPAFLWMREHARTHGWFDTVVRPAAVGTLVATALCLWTLLAADMSARFLWIGFPFAATLAAHWFDDGHLRDLLDRIRPERVVGA